MTQPTPYVPSTDFSDYSAAHPGNPHDGADLDQEFQALKTTTDEIRANLALLQRDDGFMLNGAVHPDALSPAVTVVLGGGWVPAGTWQAGLNYSPKQVVFETNSQGTFVCVAAHVSGASFTDDLNAGHWLPIAGAALENADDTDLTLSGHTVTGGLFDNGVFHAADGTPAAPVYAFYTDPNTGLTRGGPGAVDFISDGVAVARWNGQGIGVTDGASGAPGMYFKDHPATGLFYPGTNAFGISVNGVEILRTSGSAASERLEVTRSNDIIALVAAGQPHVSLSLKASGDGHVTLGDQDHQWPDTQGVAGQFLQLQDTVTGEMSWATPAGGGDLLAAANLGDIANPNAAANNLLSASGPVGVGTAVPAAFFHIVTNGAAYDFILEDNIGSYASLRFKNASDSGTVNYITNYANMIRIGTDNTDRVTVTGTGNVGVGESNPVSARLVVKGSQDFGTAIFHGTSTTAASISVKNDDQSGNAFIHCFGSGHPDTGTVLFGTDKAKSVKILTSNSARMTINAAGQVGVGTAAPTKRLHIRDDAAVNLRAGNPVFTSGAFSLQSEDDSTGLAPMELRASEFHFSSGLENNANVNVGSVNSGPLAGFRNAIINGAFDIWQRGVSHDVTGGAFYSADRYQHLLNGGDRIISTRMPFATGQTDVGGDPTYYMRLQKITSVGGGQGLRQKIENVRTFAGKQVTLSYWAKAAAALSIDAITVRQNFGNGGSTLQQVNFPSPPTYTTSWVRYSHTVVVPTISPSATIGTDHFLDIFWSMPNATWTMDIANIQLELGPIATPFERRPVGTELSLCQRYYTKDQEPDVAPGSVSSAVFSPVHKSVPQGYKLADVRLPVPMRKFPALKVYSFNGTADQISDDSGVDIGAVSFQNNSQTGFQIANNTGGNISPTAGILFHYTANAEL